MIRTLTGCNPCCWTVGTSALFRVKVVDVLNVPVLEFVDGVVLVMAVSIISGVIIVLVDLAL